MLCKVRSPPHGLEAVSSLAVLEGIPTWCMKMGSILGLNSGSAICLGKKLKPAYVSKVHRHLIEQVGVRATDGLCKKPWQTVGAQ